MAAPLQPNGPRFEHGCWEGKEGKGLLPQASVLAQPKEAGTARAAVALSPNTTQTPGPCSACVPSAPR
jgi:hypothetical protein